MANFQSRQIIDNMPVQSHGLASNVKAATFVVDIGVATAASDTVEFGYLPDYAFPIDAMAYSTGAVATGLDVGYTDDTDGLIDGLVLTANIPARSTAAATKLFKNVGVGQKKVVGVFQGIAGTGTLTVTIFYVVLDQGTGYPYIPIA
jgi:hypothetical protein